MKVKKTTKKPKTTEIQRTAYHEAGHAVMSVYLRRSFRLVSVIPDKDDESIGRVLYHKLSNINYEDIDDKAERQIQRLIMCAMAGPAAENIFSGRNSNIAFGDMEHIKILVTILISDQEELSLYTRWLWVKTRNIMLMPINQVSTKALAEALLERKSLSSKAARKIMHDAILKSVKVPPIMIRMTNEADNRTK
jgi:hypothetical protein